MSLIYIKNLTKSFGDHVVLDNVTMSIEPGEKIAFVAPNGAGKSTLMKIILGVMEYDEGEITYDPYMRIGYMAQSPRLDYETVGEVIFDSQNTKLALLKSYREDMDDMTPAEQMKLKDEMDIHDVWGYEKNLNIILESCKIPALDSKFIPLSGGQKQRVMLAAALLDEPDLLCLDEPTNHMDIEILSWLESYLNKAKTALLMITHDRYFQDEICTSVLEIDENTIFKYNGNYTEYIRQKTEREDMDNKSILKARSLLRKEEEWMRSSARARQSKSRKRKEDYYVLKELAKQKVKMTLEFNMKPMRLGGKILEVHDLNKSYGDKKIVNDFTYRFTQGQKIGLVGPNGAGKSTLLELIMQNIPKDSGKIETGKTVTFGYFSQHIPEFDPNLKAIDVIKQHSDAFLQATTTRIPISKMMEQFMFSGREQHTQIRFLSGGQRRRLFLMTVLLANPNFLILDEPTNDLDTMTLEVMEKFLNAYEGNLLVVSHDRYFMNKVVDMLFVFEPGGSITAFDGDYDQYFKTYSQKSKTPRNQVVISSAETSSVQPPQITLSKSEKKQMRKLERDIEKIEAKKTALITQLSEPGLNYLIIQQLSVQIQEFVDKITEKTETWSKLADKS